MVLASPLACGARAEEAAPAGVDAEPEALPFDAGSILDATGRVPVKHRPAHVDCPRDRPPGDAVGFDAAASTCTKDADCVAGKNGRCTKMYAHDECTYDECFVDADCPGHRVCICGSPASYGRSATGSACAKSGDCRLDADCGPGGFCSPSFGYDGDTWWCHTPKDTCLDDSDCADAPYGARYCLHEPVAGAWTCTYVAPSPAG